MADDSIYPKKNQTHVAVSETNKMNILAQKMEQWTDTEYPTQQSAYGQCADATQRMANVFPTLTRVRGHYHCPVWGMRAHWWLIDEDGTIVDPTSRQFPSAGLGVYEPWQEGDNEPTGKCMHCGNYCYNGDVACSESCQREIVLYYEKG